MSFKVERKQKFNMGKSYNPKPVSENDINQGLQKMFTDTQKQKKQNVSFGQKPFGAKIETPKFGQQKFGKPMFGQSKQENSPQLSFTPPKPELKPELEEETPYWSSEEWERWAYDMYSQYQETRQFLPDWFIEAVEQPQE